MVNGAIGLYVPKAVIRDRCARYMKKGKPAYRGLLLHDEDFTIVAKYGSEYRGFVQYYLLAQDVFRLARLRWVMETSMLKTLARKHTSTVTKMARKYKTTIDTPDGRGPASRSPCRERAGNHWSPASAGSRSSASAPPSSPTANRPWPPPSATS